MKATRIAFDGDRATVRLRPSWLARLLGARESEIELEWYEEGKGAHKSAGWLAVGSRRWLEDLDFRDLEIIKRALDFAPVAPLPRAEVVAPSGAIARTR